MHPTAQRLQRRLHDLGLEIEVRELADSTRTAPEAAAARAIDASIRRSWEPTSGRHAATRSGRQPASPSAGSHLWATIVLFGRWSTPHSAASRRSGARPELRMLSSP